jgi:hypothetical protein
MLAVCINRVARFLLVQHTKMGKAYQITKNIPNGNKIYQTAINIDQRLPLQVPQKFTKIGIFKFENIPSGNPV